MKRDKNRYKILVFVLTFIIVLITAKLVADMTGMIEHPVMKWIGIAVLIAGAVALIGGMMTFYVNLVGNDRQYRSLMDVADRMSVFAVLWDTDKKYFYVNAAFTADTGYTSSDLEDPEKLARVFPAAALTGNEDDLVQFMENRVEFEIQCKTGGYVTTSWATSPMFVLENGSQILMSVGSNLNDEIRLKKALVTASEALSESERRYFLSTELSEVGLILRYEGREDFYVSEQLGHMLGISEKEGFVSTEQLKERIHPEDRILLRSFTQSICADDTESVDVRALAHDDDYHWFTVRYKTVKVDDQLITGGSVIDVTDDKEKDRIIEKMAYIDDVTQIYNRNRFMMIGSEMLGSVRRQDNSGETYWVVIADLDSFHIINDTCGYESGNDLLKRFAMIIMKNIPEGSMAARIGGDNFAVLMKADTEDDVKVFFEGVRSGLTTVSGGGLEKHSITCSFGYCMMNNPDFRHEEFSEILEHAEFALNLTRNVKNSAMRYDAQLRDGVVDRSNLEKEIEEALKNHEFMLYYQPKISLSDGSIIGMEGLIRWIKPDGRIIPPIEFIPVAEGSMLITRISDFVLHEACRENKRLQELGFPPVTVSINLTAIDFYKTNVTKTIADVLEETGLEPQYLDVELTESLALKDIQHAIIQMNEMRKLGIKLSMDDFGTGYSSLSYIQQLPITLLKLDRSFIMYLEEDEVSREIVSAIIRIAKSKQIETIAEGVESTGQSDILRESGCDYAQGYFYGKPMPAPQFEEFLRTWQGIGK